MVVVSEIVAPPDFVEIWNMDRYRSACQSLKTGKKILTSAGATETTDKEDFTKSEKLFIWSGSPAIALAVADEVKHPSL